MNPNLALVLASARKDLVRRARDPIAFLLWVGVPLVLALLIGSVAGGDGKARPRGRLLVADLDDSFLSRAVVAAFSQGELGKSFDVEPVEVIAGRERMRQGDAAALVVLPLGFGDALWLDEPATIELVKNPSMKILPRMVEEVLGLCCDAAFYAQRVGGDRVRGSLRTLAGAPSEKPAAEARSAPRKTPETSLNFAADPLVAGLAVEIQDTVERVSRWVDPLAIEVVDAPADEAEPQLDFGRLFFPSMLFLSLMFLAQGLSEDLWREKTLGTLRRAAAGPLGLPPLLWGKLLAAGVLAASVAATGLAFGAWRFGFSVSALPVAWGWLALSGALMFTLFLLAQAHARTQRGGNLAGNALMFPLAMLGGSFFPVEVLPDWMVAVGRFTPNGWAMAEFRAILDGSRDVAALALDVALILAATGLVFLWLARRTAREFVRS